MPQMSRILCQTCRPSVLRICIILLGSIVLAAQSVAAQEGACSSNLEISQDYRAAMGKPACTVYGDLMMKSKSDDHVGFFEIMNSLEDDSSYRVFISNQLAFLTFERGFRGDSVPTQAEMQTIVSYLTFANFWVTNEEISIAERQIQLLAYVSVLDILYETDLNDAFWWILSGPGPHGLEEAKYRPICVLRNLAPGVDQEDIYVSRDYQSCMADNKYLD